MTDLKIVASTATLVREANRLADQGRWEAARPLVAAARELGFPALDLAVLSARIANRSTDAEHGDLDAAINLAPENTELLKFRADLRQRSENFEGAARDAAAAVVVDSEDPEAKAILGRALIALDRVSDGVKCLSDAVRGSPADPRYREALAAGLERRGDSETAFRVLVDGINLCPTSLAMRNAAILLCNRQSDFARAAQIAEEARMAGIADGNTFGMAGHALANLGEHDRAAAAYREALKLCPEDQDLRVLVAASEDNAALSRTPESYIRGFFDGHADQFESQVLSLRYSAPVRIRSLLLGHGEVGAGRSLGPALDLGCGSGLVALALDGLGIGPFTGVDVAPRMLAYARAKGLYEELRQNDIIAELSADRNQWPLIVAADVVCYFGNIEELLLLVHQRLTDQGWFIFSLERFIGAIEFGQEDDKRWSRLGNGRFVHAEHYVYEAACAAGFRVLHWDRSAIRQEAGKDIPGLLIALQRRDRPGYAGGP